MERPTPQDERKSEPISCEASWNQTDCICIGVEWAWIERKPESTRQLPGRSLFRLGRVVQLWRATPRQGRFACTGFA